MIACTYMDPLKESVSRLAEMAFAEDIPDGDITSNSLALAGNHARARLICREEVKMCGAVWSDLIRAAFLKTAPNADIHLTACFQDGETAPKGSVLFRLEGQAAAILAVERTLLNFLGRAIGIATLTGRYVAAVRKHNDHTNVLDTRKTLPGYRYFDKYAVLCGGGVNHRMNLSDMVLVKENHIARFEGIDRVMAHLAGVDKPVEIEVQNFSELNQAIAAKAPIIMLDNFTPEDVARACEIPRGDCRLEVSGGITLETIGDYCHPKLDRISIGALTHSVKAPDLSLLMEEE